MNKFMLCAVGSRDSEENRKQFRHSTHICVFVPHEHMKQGFRSADGGGFQAGGQEGTHGASRLAC